MGAVALDVDLGHHRKADPEVELAEGRDLVVVGELLAGEGESATHSDAPTFTFIIEPLDEQAAKAKAYLYIEPNPQAFPLSAKQLEKLRSLLPSVEFIDSRALLASNCRAFSSSPAASRP